MADAEKGFVRDRIIEQFENLKAHEKGSARSSQWQMILSVRPEIEEMLRVGYTAVQIHKAITAAGFELSYDNLCSFIRPWTAAVRSSEPGYIERRRRGRSASPQAAAESSAAGKMADYEDRLDPSEY